VNNVIEVLLMLIGVLLAITIAASFEYYTYVRKAQKEYEKAREAVEDIVLSFNRELKREADRLELVAYRVEGNTAKANASLKKAESIDQKFRPIEVKMLSISEKDENVMSKIAEVNTKTQNIETAQQTLKIKMEELEAELQKLGLAESTQQD
jgi:predicted  nucleic acid-binding Zn-ribbon protein